jgi:hypothetical protein
MKYAAIAGLIVTSASLWSGVSGVAADEFRLDARSMDAVTAAGNVNFNTNVFKNVNINKNVTLTVNKNVTSTVSVTGNLATAEASADSAGFTNNLAETDTFAQVQPGGAFSFSESLAAGTNGTAAP